MGATSGLLLYSQQVLIGEIRWDEKAGLRRDAVRSQVIDALEAQEIKETGNEERSSKGKAKAQSRVSVTASIAWPDFHSYEWNERSKIRWQHRLKREHPTGTERTESLLEECGWKGGDSGDSAGEKSCPTKKNKNPLDSDRPSHGRR